jgi:type IV pilus assembly protein PilE
MNASKLWSGARAMRGVTLIELMIVVVIIGIIAAIAYPSYQNQIQQTRRADGKAALLEAAQRLERCYTRYNSYADAACDVAVDLGDGDGIASPEGWYVITDTNATASTFSLLGTPQNGQTADTRCANLSLTHQGIRNASGTQAATCW